MASAVEAKELKNDWIHRVLLYQFQTPFFCFLSYGIIHFVRSVKTILIKTSDWLWRNLNHSESGFCTKRKGMRDCARKCVDVRFLFNANCTFGKMCFISPGTVRITYMHLVESYTPSSIMIKSSHIKSLQKYTRNILKGLNICAWNCPLNLCIFKWAGN